MAQQPISIIGAGLGGLTLGRCLLKRGIPAVLYERAASSPRHSYGITLQPSTYRPLLKVLDLDEQTFKNRIAVDGAVGGLGAIDCKKLVHPVRPGSFRANRGKLEGLLREGLDIRWDHELAKLEITPTGLSMSLENGHWSEQTCVIGADGVHANTRKSLISNVELNILPFVTFNALQDSNIVELRRSGAVLQVSINDHTEDVISVSWTYSRPAHGATDPLYKPNRPVASATNIPDDFYHEIGTLPGLEQPFKDIFDEEKLRKERILSWLMRTTEISLPRLQELGRNGVLFIGDSVHAQPILGGEGANAAMTDAAELADHIAANGITSIAECDLQACEVKSRRNFASRKPTWCGFCETHILEGKARLNHIADHFKLEKRAIKDWKDESRPDSDNGTNDDDLGPGGSGSDDKTENSNGDNHEPERDEFGSGYNFENQDDEFPGNGLSGCGAYYGWNTSIVDAGRTTLMSNRSRHSKIDYSAPMSIRTLGMGSSGIVDEVIIPGLEGTLARKIIHYRNKRQLQSAMNETRILRALCHPSIIRCFDAFRSDDAVHIYMTPVAKTNLAAFMEDAIATSHVNNALHDGFFALASAVGYLHDGLDNRLGYCHRDIKPSNILVNRDGTMILSDFGAAVELRSDGLANAKSWVGSHKYGAPECYRSDLDGMTNGGKASDVWSLGCVFAEMLSWLSWQGPSGLRTRLGSRPYRHLLDPLNELLDGPISHNIIEIGIWPEMKVIEFLRATKAMLSRNPRTRPDAIILSQIFRSTSRLSNTLGNSHVSEISFHDRHSKATALVVAKDTALDDSFKVVDTVGMGRSSQMSLAQFWYPIFDTPILEDRGQYDHTKAKIKLDVANTRDGCLLSLDGGGIRGCHEFWILETLMQMQPLENEDLFGDKFIETEDLLPCRYFDYMYGTSTGGLIAIMLARSSKMEMEEEVTVSIMVLTSRSTTFTTQNLLDT
ncbi:hypothetical protein MBLNU459_g5272t1 [Dothideomycetes sp. NU459]